MAIDSVCKIEVDKSMAQYTSEYKGKNTHFPPLGYALFHHPPYNTSLRLIHTIAYLAALGCSEDVCNGCSV